VNSNHTAFTVNRKVAKKRFGPDDGQRISKNKSNEATTMPTGKNAENPMNNDNADFRKCVNFTLYASISHVIDKHWHLTSKNASISRIAFKRTKTGFLGVFPSGRYGHTKRQSNTLETGFLRRETTNRHQQAPTGAKKRPTGTIYKQKTGYL